MRRAKVRARAGRVHPARAHARPCAQPLTGGGTRARRVRRYVGFLLLVLTILYIPISRQALSVFVCQEANCGRGEWFPVQSPGTDADLSSYINEFASEYSQVVASYKMNNGTAVADSMVLSLAPPDSCEACAFLSGPGPDGKCPAAMAAALCPSMHSLRLVAAPQIDCEAQWPYYIPGAILTLLMFTVGLPYLFYMLTHRHVKMYESLPVYAKEEKPRGKARVSASGRFLGQTLGRSMSRRFGHHAAEVFTWFEANDQWMRRVKGARRNRAKALYADFDYSWRYWKLIILGIKFVIILIDAFKTQHADVLTAPTLMLCAHACLLLLLLFAHPYTDRRPDSFSISIAVANVFNYCVLLMMGMRVTAPSYMLTFLLLVNFLVVNLNNG